MDDERKRLLEKTIAVKKETSVKRFHLPGEAAYDYASCLSTKDPKGSFKRICGPVSSSGGHQHMSRPTSTCFTSSPIPSFVDVECSQSEPCDTGIELNVNDLLPETVRMKVCLTICV
jgi:hypothetical protein